MSEVPPPAGIDKPLSSQEPFGDTGEFHRPTSVAYERTWELELLISGAVVFALLQLPGSIDRWYHSVDMHLAGVSDEVVFLLYYYLKLIVYTLIGTFIVHLVARAYWVGLLGLDTAFPSGVRWEKLTYGPITQVVHRERQPSLEAIIRRVDRFCSIIFSFSFVLVFLFIYSLVLLGVLGIVAFAISTLFFGGEHLGKIVYALLALLIGPSVLFALIDRAMKGKLDQSHGFGRVLYRTMSASYVVMGAVTYAPVLNVLTTNLRKPLVMTVFSVSFFGVIVLFVVKDVLIPNDFVSMSSYEYLPEGEAHTVDYRFYADSREQEDRVRARPAIQSQVIRDPFVRLFLPYVPGRHEEVVERECAGVRPVGGEGLRLARPNAPEPDSVAAQAALACLSRLQPVRLNGQPLEPRYRTFTEPETGRRGVVAFLPTAGLPEGENLLTVGVVRTNLEEPVPPPYQIPFWVER